MSAPEILGSLAASGGAALVNSALNYATMGKQIERSKELMQYEWDNFKSPKAQVKALAAAGINPAVALGQGGTGFVSTPQPNLPSSIAPQVSGMDLANFVNAMAQAKKVGLESTAQEMQNDLTRKTFEDLVKKVGLDNKWKQSEIIKIDNEVSKLVADVHQIEKNVILSDKQIKWFDRNMSAEIEDLKQSAEYHKALASLTLEQKDLLSSTMDDLKSYAHYNTEQLKKIVDLLGKYGDAQAIVGMVSSIVSSASDFIGNFVPSKQIKKVIND